MGEGRSLERPESARVKVIVNPRAGGVGARGGALVRLIQEALPGCEIRFTEFAGHGTELAREAAGYDLVVAVGGDGTLGEVVNGLAGGRAALGIIPAGTGNDFARTVDIPRRVRGALGVLRNGVKRRIDLGAVDGRLFINVAGVGFDAEVAKAYHQGHRYLTPAITYIIYIIKTLALYRPVPMTFQSNGTAAVPRPTLFAAVANGRYYAGGMAIAPEAALDDGLLDLMVAGDLSPRETVVALPQAFRGRHLAHPKCDYRQVSAVTVEAERPVPVIADGDVVGTTPAVFSVHAGAMDIIVPGRAAAGGGGAG